MRSFIALLALAAIANAATVAQTDAEEPVAEEVAAEVAEAEDRTPGDCPEGFIALPECDVATTATCVRVAPPIKYVSWLHLQYMCDSVGGYLPEITEKNEAPLKLLLQSYEQLYGASTLYLGGTDITADGTWKWLSSGTELANTEKWATGVTAGDDDGVNKDCLAQSSTDLLWNKVNCEADSDNDIQIANICLAAAEKA